MATSKFGEALLMPRGKGRAVLPQAVKAWLSDKNLTDGADLAVTAEQGPHLYGFVRAHKRQWNKRVRSVKMRGTWVDRRFRKSGIALKMWEEFLKHNRITSVYVVTISHGGTALVKSLRKRHPEIRWHHEILQD